MSSKILTPQSAELCQSPALVIWNNETFTEEDSVGLPSTGKGGKQGNNETIGRFGLGTLSFYHFTEMVMVVSGNRVAFLDPSGRYLPRTGRSPRTSLITSLEVCRRKYLGHLQPLEGLFGFSSTQSSYEGTLFRLPLRTSQQTTASKLSNTFYSAVELHDLMKTKFFDQAEKSLFFSKIESISAQRRNTGMALLPMWSVHGIRQTSTVIMSGDLLKTTEMRLETIVNSEPARAQNWLIHTTKTKHDGVPEVFRHLAADHRLPPPSIGLAIRLTAKDKATEPHAPAQYRLFATLPLPILTKLPVHIHATWILAADRRSIRFDAKDADGARPRDTQYNLYLLENLIPTLYLRMLATLALRYPRDWYQCWPVKTHEYLQPIVTALYKQVVNTTLCVFRTVTGDAVAPSAAIFPVSGSKHVRALLRALELPQFVDPLPFDVSLLSWESLQTDDTAKVAEVLRANSEAVKRLFSISSELPRNSLVQDHLDGIIRYLDKGEENLVGLPLLQLGSGEITTFEDKNRPWIFWDFPSSPVVGSAPTLISALFTPKRVVGRAITATTCQLLIKRGGNVRSLDAEGLRQLLKQLPVPITPCTSAEISTTRMAWLPKLLDFLASYQTPRLDDVCDLPLIPVLNGNIAISLNKARDSTVFVSTSISGMSRLNSAILLGILVIRAFPGVPTQAPIDLARLLAALRSFGRNLRIMNQGLSPPDWLSLVQWLRESLISHMNLTRQDRGTLLALPMFKARKGGPQSIEEWYPTSEIYMLPSAVRLAAVARYLSHDMYFSDFSQELSIVLEGHSSQVLSHDDLFRHLQLPASISADEDRHFKHILAVITAHWRGGDFPSPLVPDTNLVLRRPKDLYDHRVQLFVTALGNRPSKFVHPQYRTDMSGLVRVGLWTQFDVPSLIVCDGS
ncbi:hypothetical protein FRB94_007228 [Tulasnella sp. JGI-2019a]|nr:hypothetical protein FRB94_007228 [Tulasnella sp. JGI-2019a]KAG9010589.1 hypothetical protein FRB93_003857 [Tulasnella sp. JGI-2019a]